MVQAPSGDDRTATFSAATLQRIDVNAKASQALILNPSRELGMQLQEFIVKLSGSSKISIGNVNIGDVARESAKVCQDGTQVIIGTSGRMYDMINRSLLKTDKIKTVIVDNADDGQYQNRTDEIYEVLLKVPSSAQIILLSATASRLVLDIASKRMRGIVRISTNPGDSIFQGSKHYKLNASNDQEKFETLCDFFEASPSRAVFCNTREKADWLVSKLTDMGFTASALHSDTPAASRTQIAQAFKSGSGGTLVTSDPKVSGVDLMDVDYSFGFDLPLDAKDYIHRVGWQSKVMNFVTSSDGAKLKEIEQLYSIQIKDLPQSGTF